MMRRQPNCTVANRRGVVLFMVVSIVLMLTLLTYGFLIAMRNQNLSAAQSGDHLQARQAAFSARELVCFVLESSLEKRMQMGGIDSNSELFQRISLALEDNEEEFESSGFVVSNHTGAIFGVDNQSGKIALSTLLAMDIESPGWARECLLRLPDMDETLADHILDWIDADDEPREFGAESSFYIDSGMVPPRNNVPPSLDELTRIPGINEKLIWGVRMSRDSQSGSDESTGGGDAGEDVSSNGWSEYLTVYSGERNETFEGDPRIDLNSKDLADLHSRLAEKSGVEIANYVVLVRQFGLREKDSAGSESESARQIALNAVQIDLTVPPIYEIENKLELFDSSVTMGAEDESEKTYVKSPLSPSSTNLGDLLIGFLDGTTTDANSVIRGRVNLNLAPRVVLMSVPGIDETLADQIISNREAQKNGAKTCFWLLETGLVNMETMRQIEPWVTNRGEVCRFLCGGWSDSRSAPLVFDVTVDATSGNAKQIRCKRILETFDFSRRLQAADTLR